jgi:hypothetical protein
MALMMSDFLHESSILNALIIEAHLSLEELDLRFVHDLIVDLFNTNINGSKYWMN